jgi:hypothetical protein
MTDLWFLGAAEPWGSGGFESPDPVTQGSSWTWDVEFSTDSTQWTYARTSLAAFAEPGGGWGWAQAGIVSYRTRGADGVDTDHPVGASNPNGVAAFMNDMGVDDVTFGWLLGGQELCEATVNMEIWVSD